MSYIFGRVIPAIRNFFQFKPIASYLLMTTVDMENNAEWHIVHQS
ncbi:hypothetical protein BJP35_2351 [Enterobacter sp. J49]|nr:hypothetical protein BJP35_2351 [Enterobacter sp. J49]